MFHLNAARGKGYATEKNARKKLDDVLAKFGITECTYLIAVNNEGRFVPVVIKKDPTDLALCHHGITVIG